VEGFRHGLELAKRFSESGSESYTEVTINAWNEWTEGSYLLPDTMTGLGYLEAIREVFGAPLADRSTSSAVEESA
jgi:hypothetical protein